MNKTVLLRLSGAAFLASCSYALCRMPVLPLLARDLGAAPATVGLIVGASTLTGMVLKLPAGAASDVWGRRALLMTAGLVFALMPWAYFGVASLAMLAAVRFAHGSATAIFGPVTAASVADIAPPDRRATWLGALAMAQGMGQAAAPAAAGILLARAGYDAVFAAGAALGIAVPLLLVRWPAGAPRPGDGRGHGFGSGVAATLRDRVIVMTSLTQAALLAAQAAVMAFLPLYAAEALKLGPAAIGMLFAVQAITLLAARPLAGHVADRLGRQPMIAAGPIACGIAIACLPMAPGPLSLAALLVVNAMARAMTSTAASALITDRARHGQYGAAHGVFGTIYDAGDALGPIAGGFLVSAIGYAGMFEAAAAVALLAAARLAPGPRLDIAEARTGGRQPRPRVSAVHWRKLP